MLATSPCPACGQDVTTPAGDLTKQNPQHRSRSRLPGRLRCVSRAPLPNLRGGMRMRVVHGQYQFCLHRNVLSSLINAYEIKVT